MSIDKFKIPHDRLGVVVPHLIVSNAKEALEAYKKAFNAEVVRIHETPNDWRIMHSEVKVFNSILYVVDDFPEWRLGGKQLHPKALGGSCVCLNFAVEDVDQVYANAIKAGFSPKMPPADQFWGDRYCQVIDPFGHDWSFATPLKGGPETWPKMDFFSSKGGERDEKKVKK